MVVAEVVEIVEVMVTRIEIKVRLLIKIIKSGIQMEEKNQVAKHLTINKIMCNKIPQKNIFWGILHCPLSLLVTGVVYSSLTA